MSFYNVGFVHSNFNSVFNSPNPTRITKRFSDIRRWVWLVEGHSSLVEVASVYGVEEAKGLANSDAGY